MEEGTAYPYGAPEFTAGFSWGSWYSIFSFMYMFFFVDRCFSFCPFTFGHCVLIWFTDSDYLPFGILKPNPNRWHLFFSVFHQLQQVFGQLLESKLQYYEPEKFWKIFKLWGQVVNIREQQDAFDFFTALIDQGDEHTKVMFE